MCAQPSAEHRSHPHRPREDNADAERRGRVFGNEPRQQAKRGGYAATAERANSAIPGIKFCGQLMHGFKSLAVCDRHVRI